MTRYDGPAGAIFVAVAAYIAMSDLATRADYDEELQGALERISSRRSFWSRLFS